jgi:hypothetical protein
LKAEGPLANVARFRQFRDTENKEFSAIKRSLSFEVWRPIVESVQPPTVPARFENPVSIGSSGKRAE